MTNEWKRRSGAALTQIAMQAGLATPEDAERALMIGARMLAHGFTDREIDKMVMKALLPESYGR
jgi:hypothetical protein